MSTNRVGYAASVVAILVAGCGGSADRSAPAAPVHSASIVEHRAMSLQALGTYTNVIQKIYVGYFGRPADPGGLSFYADHFERLQAPGNIVELSRAYYTDPTLRLIIDSFGTSAESVSLYPGDNDAFISAIYQNLFNRAPDAVGKAFWVGNLNAGRLTRGNAVIAIMAGATTTDITSIENKTVLAGLFTDRLNSPERVAAYSGLRPGVLARQMLAGVGKDPAPLTDHARVDATLAAMTALAQSASSGTLPAALATLSPTTLYRETRADLSKSLSFTAANLTLAAQQTPTGTVELSMNSADGKISLVRDQAAGTAVMKDEASNLTLVSESGPKGTLIRSYDQDKRYVVGYYIEVEAGGSRVLWRLRQDGSTDPGNLTAGRYLPARPATFEASRAAVQLASAGSECHDFMSGITSDGASTMEDMGEAMDQDGATSQTKAVGLAAKFMGSIWSRVPKLCSDAPEPLSDAAFGRETVIELLRTVGPAGVRDAVDKYATFKEYLDELKRRAQALRTAILAAPAAERAAVGIAIDIPAPIGRDIVVADPAAEIAARLAVSPPAKVYVSDSVSCVRYSDGPSYITYSNDCSVPVTVAWCFSTSSAGCTISSTSALAVRGTVQAQPPSWARYRFHGACPLSYQDKPVSITQVSLTQFTCSYNSR